MKHERRHHLRLPTAIGAVASLLCAVTPLSAQPQPPVGPDPGESAPEEGDGTGTTASDSENQGEREGEPAVREPAPIEEFSPEPPPEMPSAPVQPAAEPSETRKQSPRTVPPAAVHRDASEPKQPSGVGVLPPPKLVPTTEPSWLDDLEYRVFADAYYALDYGFPKPQIGPRNEVRAYDLAAGFGLAWAGADVGLEPAPIGGQLSLRWGPAAERYADSCVSESEPCDADVGLSFLKQAYASWRPGSGFVRLDFGKFDTIYGAEVAESQDNINYTRGLLYWLGQPLFHTGLRAQFDVHRSFTANALVVNGWNNSVDNNAGKSFGLQLIYRMPQAADEKRDLLSAALGYMLGPEHDDVERVECLPGQGFDPAQGCVVDPGSAGGTFLRDRAASDTEGLRHFFDLLLHVGPTESLELLFNSSVAFDRVRDPEDSNAFDTVSWWGVMTGARLALNDVFALGARGEYFRDVDGALIPRARGIDLISGTLTLDVVPAPGLLLRLDNRLDWAEKQIFRSSVRETEGFLVTSTLGVVVTTN